MNETLTISIKTLTPIWTGDIDSKSDLLLSTGIMGSIRWWTEATLRGLNKFACDPVENENRCPKETSHYCSACLIFGATGLRRTFRLQVSGGEKIFDGGIINIKPTGRTRGWYSGSGLNGEIKLEIIPLDKDFGKNLILVPLYIAAKWGAIGAKTQHGYGVVKPEDIVKVKIEDFKNSLDIKIKNQDIRDEKSNSLPNIQEMFFAKLQFEKVDNDWWREVDGIWQALAPKDKEGNLDKGKQKSNTNILNSWIKSGSVPIAPAIKNWLRFKEGRQLWQGINENWLFGTTSRVCISCYSRVRDNKNAFENKKKKHWCNTCHKPLEDYETIERLTSKINISCAYSIDDKIWELRIWGWISKNNSISTSVREHFLDCLKTSFDGSSSVKFPWNNLLGSKTKEHKLKVWREFNSLRDTIKKSETDPNRFLQSLLDAEEKI